VDCSQCHKFLRTGFALSLIGHLEQHHDMHEDDAIRVGTHMLDLLHEAKLKRRRDSGD
jgi:hypothetical protein